MRAELAGKLGLAVASLVLALGLSELVARQLGLGSHPPPVREVQVPRSDGTWRKVSDWGVARLKRASPFPGIRAGEFVPGQRFRFVYYDRAEDAGAPERASHIANVSINSSGLRERELPSRKRPDTTRILFVGDSFTFGAGVQDDEPFPRLVETLLNRDLGADQVRYETINAGISGYNTRDEVTYLEHRWLAFDPDLVVLTFYLNDAYDEALLRPLMLGEASASALRAPLADSPSHAVRFLAGRLARWREGRRLTALYRAQFSDRPSIAGHDWWDARRALERARELTAERGIALVLVIFPELHDLGDRHPFLGIYAQVAADAAKLDIPTLNLFPHFEGRDARSLWVHATDHHPNAYAHELAAQAIAGFLTGPDGGLLAR